MKQKPITFESRYTRRGGDGETLFSEKLPYINNKGERVIELIVEMIFDKQICCNVLISILTFKAYEIYASDYKPHCIYTKEVSNSFSDVCLDIIPSSEQKQLIEALCSGDLRGRYAENIAKSLYVDLFLMNPKSKMKELFPDIVEFWVSFWAEYNIERVSK
jgi:hypothetical protein